MLLSSEGKSYDTGKIAGGGLLTALVLLFISLSYLSPTADIALMSLASLVIAIAVVRYGFRIAATVLLASSLISAVWPGIFFALPFIILFGPWPLIKAWIEKKHNQAAAVLFKQLAATFLLAVASILYLQIFRIDPRMLIPLEVIAKLPGFWFWLAILAVAEIVFCFYDWALTLLITIYMRRIDGRI